VKYRLIVLVLSSCGSPFNKFKEIWERYAFSFPNIKTYFVYAGDELRERKGYDLVYEDVKDSYPMNIERTLKAFEYIDSEYDYDFLLRTNLSTFWDFERLLANLSDLPEINCYQGDGPLPPWVPPSERYYLSGTDTIVNRNMITELVSSTKENPSLRQELFAKSEEDAAMGRFFHKILGASMLKSNIHFMEYFRSEDKPEVLRQIRMAKLMNHDHFRIKSAVDRGELDAFIMETLCQEYYGEK
jgi:hypothetical protein